MTLSAAALFALAVMGIVLAIVAATTLIDRRRPRIDSSQPEERRRPF